MESGRQDFFSFLVSSKDCPTGRGKPPVLAQGFNKASLACFSSSGAVSPRHIYSYPHPRHTLYLQARMLQPLVVHNAVRTSKVRKQQGTGALVHNSGICGVQARRSGQTKISSRTDKGQLRPFFI